MDCSRINTGTIGSVIYTQSNSKIQIFVLKSGILLFDGRTWDNTGEAK